MKSAEFTDYASAQAFLAAGRKKGERSTNDGWNTVLSEDGADLVLKLHGTEIVRYNSARTEINIPMRNHVVADRIQRYGFADQFQLVTAPRAWSLSQKWGELVGIHENPSVWYPIVPDLPSVVTIDTVGGLLAPVAPPMPTVLSGVDRARILEPAVKKWLSAAMKKLDAGWTFKAEEWKLCPACMGRTQPGDQMLGWFASHRHLISHVLEGIVLPATVVGLVVQTGNQRVLNATIDMSGNGTIGDGSSSVYNHDAVRRALKNQLRYATR